LKEAAESHFSPGSWELGWSDDEEEIDDSASEWTVVEDEDWPASGDSRDGDYNYETLSQYSSENDEWGPSENGIDSDRVTRRYEEVEELVRIYITWQDRQRKQEGRKLEYLLKLKAILDTRKRAFVSAVEVYEEGIRRDFEGL
jgi:hypothetical protein